MADNTVIYDNRVLTKVTLGIAKKKNFFQDTFFSKAIQSNTDTIQLDLVALGNEMAPAVTPLSEGSVINKKGYSTTVLKTAYFAPYNNITPQDFMYRSAGVDPYSPGNNEMEVVTRHLVDLKASIENAQELMCAEAITTGKITYEYKLGNETKKQEVDFGRKADHKIALTGTSSWDKTDAKIIDNIRNWRSLILKDGYGVQADTLVLGSAAAAVFFKDEAIKDLFSSSKYGVVKMEVSSDMPGLYSYGYIPGIGNVYEYERYYDKDGKSVNMLDEKSVVYGASKAGNFMAYGAIQNFLANPAGGLLPTQYFASFDNKDSKNKRIQVESSFLPCLANVNSVVAGKVLE